MSERKLPLFDPSKARGPRSAPDVGEDVTGEFAAKAGLQPLTVSALVAQIKGALADAFPKAVHVVGQISGLKVHASGHLYFRLKDAEAAIDAVMFRTAAARMKFTPADGLEVVAAGRVDLYETQGRLQFYVERMTPKGQGALELAFRQLVEKLRAEGLFDPARKSPLPRFPRAIGVVTSPTGAAIRDIRRTLSRRWPAARVYLVPVQVQGEEAAGQIAAAVRRLDAAAERYAIDTIIVARGGGSLEDLWAFNADAVARAIHACRTPVISGVGHEVDVTVADMVADVRAPTPTGAAELAVPDAVEVRREVASLLGRARRCALEALRGARAGLDAVGRSVVFRDPAHRLRTQMQRIDELSHRLRGGLVAALGRSRGRLEPAANRLAGLHPSRLCERASARLAHLTQRLAWVLGGRSKRAGDRLAEMTGRLRGAHPRGRLELAAARVEAARRQLEAMSYRGALKRGYSVTRGPDGTIVRSAAHARAGDAIVTEVCDGEIASRVTRTKHKPADTSPSPAGRKDRDDRPAGRRKSDRAGPTLFDAQ
ncbi:MAG TPA: exodeoxyribonuclease VII large subunit [Phycisphaerae bacterium]|nr:exodeoxyribonuclease VII large subunit [Phycisphaerae bacterium]